MHDTAYETGRLFLNLYAPSDPGRVLDIGSRNVNGTLKDHVPGHLEYVGIDMESGDGVDVVLSDPWQYPFKDATFDLAISTSCFEHDQFFWLTFLEVLRVLKPGGLLYINAPSNGPYHGYPYDHWRFYPDAASALEAWARRSGVEVELLESGTLRRGAGEWNDCVMIFRRGGGRDDFPPRGLLMSIPDAMNVRVRGDSQMQRLTLHTEDMLLVKQLQSETTKQRAVISDLQEKVARREQRIEEVEKRLKRIESQHCSDELRQCRAELARMKASSSWALTSPVRRCGAICPPLARVGSRCIRYVRSLRNSNGRST